MMIIFSPCWGDTSLRERFTGARAGDYIITKQDHTLSVLVVRGHSGDVLTLEEISAPETHAKTLLGDVAQWIAEGAPGNTSWTSFEMDLQAGKLLSCFSHNRGEWLHLEGSESLLSKLFSLHFSKVADRERKKIGPPPQPGETDERRIWNPPLIIAGKKRKNPKFHVLQARWGKEESLLSTSLIQLYFDAENPTFPFPYWMEIQTPHYNFKVSTLDSGRSLSYRHQ